MEHSVDTEMDVNAQAPATETPARHGLLNLQPTERSPTSSEADAETSEADAEASPSEPDEEAMTEDAATEEPPGRKLDDISDMEIQISIAEVLFSSKYNGEYKEAFVKALHEALTGEDTIANCCEKYDIPSSTFHGYMSKLKAKLGLAPVDVVKRPENKRPFAFVDVDEDEPAAPEKKKRKYTKPTTSAAASRNVPIPDHWIQDEAKLQEVIWSVVSKCQYSEEEKKRRLYQAIMDIFVSKKGSKSAAVDQDLPQSTVQSYVRRCKAEAEKVFGPGDGGAILSASAENAAESSDSSNGEEGGSQKQPKKNTPATRPQQLFPFPFPASGETPTNQLDANEAMATMAASFMSSPLVQQCLAFQTMMNNVGAGGGPLLNMMNETMKATVGQAMQSFPNLNTTPTMNNFFGVPAAPPPTPASAAVKKGALNQQSSLRPAPAVKADLPPSNVSSTPAVPEEPAIEIPQGSVPKVTPEEFHHQSIIFDRKQLSTKFVYYFIEHSRSPNAIQENLKILMQHIPSAFPAFLYKIRPEKSNTATFKDSLEGNQLFYDHLLSKLPKFLDEVVTEKNLEHILEYLKPFARANMVIDADFTRFLILHVLKDRSLEELYDEEEYNAMHHKILSCLHNE